MKTLNHHELGLFTDLYELTMLQAYYDQDMHENAVFTLFVRELPATRNYLLACGLDTLLEYLENFSFNADDIDYLRSLDKFSDSFLDWLHNFRFTGQVRAMPEGTPCFGHEPLLEVSAPLPQAQVIETLVMNQMQLQTVLASKASRVANAAEGRSVLDFGPRRMHGIDAAVKGARAYYIAGINATSNVLAGKLYNVPVAGTMAHSYIQAHDDEQKAFDNFIKSYPQTVLLVDTFDTLSGVQKVIQLAERLGDKFAVQGIRLDSGDLAELAHKARQQLNKAGLQKMQIMVSGGLDESAIEDLVKSGAPVDGFGVGTDMGVSQDSPALDIAYKLCYYAGKGRLKLSSGKPILPGAKQVFRVSDNEGYCGDTIARADEKLPGRPLLQEVMRDGRRLASHTQDLEDIRNYSQAQVQQLPARFRRLQKQDTPYPVAVSDKLSTYQHQVSEAVKKGGYDE
ncbi:nicotinate phosphoribosyltransferase [Aliidiomarina minuta]|uniref:Nicotinate phosphoribosyltransferase n=1 Tax=Aliidiomarina minuta TaxID=880057 RepID=A0A432W3U0_9GAMM|nr:nicotinate phosphoribosyltransferase [Aliidiomarina minuta]RUO23939.1 nicotinate phosphoribosyltransferase [Aliidiomarina minuta]